MQYALPLVLPDVPAGGVCAGIDWATADHVVCVVGMTGRVTGRFSAAHDKAGIAALITRLRRSEVTEVAIERGDGPLVDALLAAGLTVVVITSRQVKNLRSRFGAAGAKDDRFDAFVLADTLRTDRARLRPLVPGTPATISLRMTVRTRRDLVRHRVAAGNQLRARLAVALPAAITLFHDLDSPISLAFLARFGSQDAAAELDEQAIRAWLATIAVRGRPAPASVLHARLQAAPPGATGADGAAQAGITAALTATLAALSAQIKALQTQIAGQLAAHPDAHIFTSLPRPGTVRAARLLAEIGDCRSRFPRPRIAGRAGRSRPGHPPVRHPHRPRLPVVGQPPAPRRPVRLRRRLPARQPLGRSHLRRRPRPRQRPSARRPHHRPRLDLRHLALLARRHRLRPRQAQRPPGRPGPASHPNRRHPAAGPVNAAIIAALRAHAAGLHPEEAGTELLIGHGGILHRDDFASFVHTGTSISDDTTLMAWIDWDAALTALHDGQIPVCSGEQRILQLAASIADGTLVSLRQAIPGLDNRDLKLLITAIRHAAGQHPR
jgi:transposase